LGVSKEISFSCPRCEHSVTLIDGSKNALMKITLKKKKKNEKKKKKLRRDTSDPE
jgi:hypothetical protein